jgi:hypothetical protein
MDHSSERNRAAAIMDPDSNNEQNYQPSAAADLGLACSGEFCPVLNSPVGGSAGCGGSCGGDNSEAEPPLGKEQIDTRLATESVDDALDMAQSRPARSTLLRWKSMRKSGGDNFHASRGRHPSSAFNQTMDVAGWVIRHLWIVERMISEFVHSHSTVKPNE